MTELVELPLELIAAPMSERMARFVDEGLRRRKRVRCFGYVPSNASVAYAALLALEPRRFVEWGSGMGTVTGIATMLGFDASGIEIDDGLADMSRELLADFDVEANIETGSYYEIARKADLYYAYCWPSQTNDLKRHFLEATPGDAKLLLCYSAEEARLMTRVA